MAATNLNTVNETAFAAAFAAAQVEAGVELPKPAPKKRVVKRGGKKSPTPRLATSDGVPVAKAPTQEKPVLRLAQLVRSWDCRESGGRINFIDLPKVEQLTALSKAIQLSEADEALLRELLEAFVANDVRRFTEILPNGVAFVRFTPDMGNAPHCCMFMEQMAKRGVNCTVLPYERAKPCTMAQLRERVAAAKARRAAAKTAARSDPRGGATYPRD